MKRYLTTTSLAAAVILGGAISASAAILDFTVDGSILSGTFKGIGYTLTGVPVAPNQDQNFDGNAHNNVPAGLLALENDGVGIDDDEISSTFAQMVTVTFDKAVTLTGVHFLDLFAAPNGASRENPIVNGGVPLAIAGALQNYQNGAAGYAFATLGPIKGTVFTFASDDPNDDEGDPDYALAALEIAPVPLPAGALLLGTALAGFGVARRRKA